MLHGNTPWSPSGYGTQMAQMVERLRELGHEITISAFFGLGGAPAAWNGVTILPANFPGDPYGAQMLGEHIRRTKADMAITLSDIWVFPAQHLKGLPVAHWMPVDCEPLSYADRTCLETSGAIPIAMSRFGERQLRQAGFDPVFVPHGIDLSAWKPPVNRDLTREMLGLTGKFAIGFNAANKDSFRKGTFEQLAAFSLLHARHPDTVLLIHGLLMEQGALDVGLMAARLGISDAVRFVDQYDYLTGQVPVQHLANWYGALDLYSCCSLGEGFGLTIAEALACGTPVVVTDASAMPEVAGAGEPVPDRFWDRRGTGGKFMRRWWNSWGEVTHLPAGWKVAGEPFWNPVHSACWVKPSVRGILSAYEKAYKGGPDYQGKRAAAVATAARWDAAEIGKSFWEPAIKELASRFGITA